MPMQHTSDFFQLRDPESDKVTVRIVVEALLDNVELPVLARVVPDSSAIVPVAVVAADVVVQLKHQSVCLMRINQSINETLEPREI